MADKYVLRVTAGPSYDLSTHQLVNVNSSTPTTISSDLISASLNVRIQNHHRSVPPTAPRTSPYFEQEPHKSNNDQYSIAFKFKLHAPERDESHRNEIGEAEDDEGEEIEEDDDIGVKGGDLQFGNDFDHPIRDRLPPGFGAAMRIVKWWVDPGLEGDPYADTPYLYGVGLSSFNAVHVGPGVEDDPKKGGIWVEEGGDEKWRIERGVPREGRERMKWGLKGENLERWVWEYGREYAVDFYNPYIDFGEFALRLPGFGLGIMRYWDGQGLRYVCFFWGGGLFVNYHLSWLYTFQLCCAPCTVGKQQVLKRRLIVTRSNAYTSLGMSSATRRRSRFTWWCCLHCT